MSSRDTPADPSFFYAGGYYMDPDDGRVVQITGGYYLDPAYGRVSNFFYWTDLETGEKGHGYGSPMIHLTPKHTTITFDLPDRGEVTYSFGVED